MPVFAPLLRRLGHLRWFAAMLRLTVPADRVLSKATTGRVVAFGLLPSLLLTTTGRKSGQPRANPVLYATDGNGYVVVGSNWGQEHQPNWALNLLAKQEASVSVDGRDIPVRAQLVTGGERDRLWRLMLAVWPAYDAYAQRAAHRDIMVFRLDPTSS